MNTEIERKIEADQTKKIQGQILTAVWTQDLPALKILLEGPENVAKMLSLRCDLTKEKLHKGANLLEAAFVNSSPEIVLFLVKIVGSNLDFLTAPTTWLPPSIRQAVSMYRDIPTPAHFKLLEAEVHWFTIKNVIKQRIKQLEKLNTEIESFEKKDTEQIVQHFFPNHYGLYSEPHLRKLAFKKNKDYFSHIWNFKKESVSILIKSYHSNLEILDSNSEAASQIIETFYYDLYQDSFRLKNVLELCKSRFPIFNVSQEQAKSIQQEILNLLTPDYEYYNSLTEKLYPYLEPRFQAYLKQSSLVYQNGNVYTLVKMREYGENILSSCDQVRKKLDDIEKTDSFDIQFGNEVRQLKVKTEEIEKGFLLFSQQRAKIVIQSKLQNRNISAEETRDAFYTCYDFHTQFLSVINDITRLYILPVKPTGIISLVSLDKTDTLTDERTLPPKIRVAADSSDPAHETKELAEDFESLPIETATSLTLEETSALQKAKLIEYKEQIAEYRRTKQKQQLENRRIALSASICQRKDHLNFEEEFEKHLDSLPTIDSGLIHDLDNFLKSTQEQWTHQDLENLLPRLGFRGRDTASNGFKWSYGLFSDTYHWNHKRTKGQDPVNHNSIRHIKAGLRTSHVLEKLLKKAAEAQKKLRH